MGTILPTSLETVLLRDPKSCNSLQVIFIWQFWRICVLKSCQIKAISRSLVQKLNWYSIAFKVWFKLTRERQLQVKIVIPKLCRANSREIFEFYGRVPEKLTIKGLFVYRNCFFKLVFPSKYPNISYLWVFQMLSLIKTWAT